MNTKVQAIIGWKLFWSIGVLVLAMSALILALSPDLTEGMLFKRIPTMSGLYAIPFSILCAAVAVRLLGKWAQSNKRKQAEPRNLNTPPQHAQEALT